MLLQVLPRRPEHTFPSLVYLGLAQSNHLGKHHLDSLPDSGLT